MKECIIALDVGGTSIKAGIIDEKLNLIYDAIDTYPSKSKKSAETIVNNIITIVYKQWDKIKKSAYIVSGIGIGFPGPFDYTKGISYMQGISKFDAIYGIDIASEIEQRICQQGRMNLSNHFKILFENDATVFALGENYKGKGMGFNKVMCITLGTGCGTTFLENGNIVKGRYGIPDSGWIFNEPFKKGIVDDYISKRGILRLAEKNGFDIKGKDVKDYSILANKGHLKAIQLFEAFGMILGEVINQYAYEFSPDVLIFGGKISRSYTLFEHKMDLNLSNGQCKISVSNNLSKSSLIGSASLFRREESFIGN